MRLYLLPITTRRTLLYGQRLNTAAAVAQQNILDKAQNRASKLWADWEKKEKGWQKSVVNYGNYALRRIPYQEWGLKSVPPLSTKRKDDELRGTDTVEVIYPKLLVPTDRVSSVLETLSTEREALHKRKLVYCLIGMPITIPFALVPIIPNLPFFYLVYRAWSHWRALAGGKHIQFLIQNKLLTLSPSPILDEVYAGVQPPLLSTPQPTTGPEEEGLPKNVSPNKAKHTDPPGEVMLLNQANGKKAAQLLDLPQLEVELERAIWQVETAMKNQEEGPKEQEKEKDKEKQQ